MMNNKRGIIRILEATIAITIILGVIVIVVSSRQRPSEPDLSATITPLLDEIAQNSTLRNDVVQKYDFVNTRNNAYVISELNAFLAARITNPSLNFSVSICNPALVCGLENYPRDVSGDVYAESRTLSSTLKEYEPKTVKIFLWRKS